MRLGLAILLAIWIDLGLTPYRAAIEVKFSPRTTTWMTVSAPGEGDGLGIGLCVGVGVGAGDGVGVGVGVGVGEDAVVAEAVGVELGASTAPEMPMIAIVPSVPATVTRVTRMGSVATLRTTFLRRPRPPMRVPSVPGPGNAVILPDTDACRTSIGGVALADADPSYRLQPV